ncbi:MAG: hypothetical protein ACRCVX_16555 [Shewanella sp.]
MKNLPEFKIGCSSISKIMGAVKGGTHDDRIKKLEAEIADRKAKEPQGDGPMATKSREVTKRLIEDLNEIKNAPFDWACVLPATCTAFLQKWAKDKAYGKRVSVTSRTLEKGNKAEIDSVALVSTYVPELSMCEKYEGSFFENDWCKGMPDIIHDGMYIADTKTAYTHETMPLFDASALNDYWWQVQGYMWLTGIKKSMVIYCLVDMPEDMLTKKARYEIGFDYTKDQFEAYAKNYRYSDVDPALRIIRYDIDYSEQATCQIAERVKNCRLYIQKVLDPAISTRKAASINVFNDYAF